MKNELAGVSFKLRLVNKSILIFLPHTSLQNSLTKASILGSDEKAPKNSSQFRVETARLIWLLLLLLLSLFVGLVKFCLGKDRERMLRNPTGSSAANA